MTTKQALDTVTPFLPDTPQVDKLKTIADAAEIGVGQAQQLYRIGQLDPEERKGEAQRFIREAVQLAGIEVTPEVNRVIDGAIEAKVLLLPKSNLLPKDDV